MQDETLIEHFKAYYFDYRRTTEAKESFMLARSAMAYHVINEVEQLANTGEKGDLPAIRDICRQFREIQGSTYGSNDSVMERLEQEYAGNKVH